MNKRKEIKRGLENKYLTHNDLTFVYGTKIT